MAQQKLRLPGESTQNPSFASPNIQTAPDVATSQKVAGNAAKPPAIPNENPTAIPAASGGTVAPKPAKNPTPTPPVTPGRTVTSVTPGGASPTTATIPTSTGAPPGVPATSAAAPSPAVTPPPAPGVPPPPAVGLAPTMKSTEGKSAAEAELINAENEQAMKLYEAALAYNSPTGALAAAQRAAEAGLRSSTANRGAAGTIESSLYGDDKSLITRNQALADTRAYVAYQEAVNSANTAMAKAQAAYQRATEQEKREIAEAAERKEQTEAIVNASRPPVATAPIPDSHGWVHTPRGSYRLGGPR